MTTQPQWLQDVMFINFQLVESGDGKKVKARGEFARADIATENGRVYPRPIWEREIKRLTQALTERKVFGELDHPCLTTDDWRVLTSDGWKPFREVSVGERIWSRREGKAILSTVTGIVDEPYKGLVYSVRGRGIDATFTPAHRFLLEKRPDRNGACSEVFVPLSAIVENSGSYAHYAIPKTAEFFSEGMAEVVIPGVSGHQIRKCKNDVSQPLHLPAELFTAFLGMYLSEGSCSADSVANYDVCISQKTPWICKFFQDEVLSKFPEGLEWRKISDGFALADARLYAYLKRLGDVYTKHIPAEIKRLGSEALKELIFWFTVGDGRMVYSGKNTRSAVVPEGVTGKEVLAESLRNGTVPFTRQDVFSVSKTLITDLHECLIRTGSSGSITRIDPDKDYEFAGRTIRAEDKVPLYQLHINRSANVWMDPRFLKIEEEQHDGRIYCLSTTEGSFYIEREGKSFWTGNSDGKTLLSRASHLLTGLELRDDGILLGEAEALDTQKGKDLQALLKSGAKIGVSSRGFGSTKPDSKGKEIVQEDYRLATFDFVADPADGTAYPEPFVESKEPGMDLKDEKKLDEEIETQVKARLQEEAARQVETAVQEREAQLREEFSSKLPGLMGKLRSDLREEVRGELLSDPSVAGARSVLESVKQILRPYVIPEDAEAVVRQKETEIKRLKETVAERDLQIKGMEEELEKVAKVAKEAGYKYYLEKTIGTEPEAELIRSLIGDVGLFESATSLKEKLATVQKQLRERRETEEAEKKRLIEEKEAYEAAERERLQALEAEREAVMTEERARAEQSRKAVFEELEQIRKDNGELLEAVEKALEANKLQGLLLYAERKLTGNPNVVSIRKILETADLKDKSHVDRIIEENSRDSDGSMDLESVRDRVRKLSKGRGYTAREEERGEDRPSREPMNEDYNGLGISVDRLQRMSGIG